MVFLADTAAAAAAAKEIIMEMASEVTKIDPTVLKVNVLAFP